MPKHIAIVMMAALVCGCVKNRPHRTFGVDTAHTSPSACVLPPPGLADACGRSTDERVPATGYACATIDTLQASTAAGAALRAELACFNTERHPASSGTALPHAGFDLHVVEFDDQGRPWNRGSMETTLERVQQSVQTPAVVLTFVHGWKNNGAVCNGNITCFRDTLELIAKGEQRLAQLASSATGQTVMPRRVVGVAIAWRGASAHSATVVPAQLSFWGRKHAAHVIGDNGAVTALIEGIRTAVRLSPRSSAIFVGHSFGGALLLSAVGNLLNGALESSRREAKGNPTYVDLDGALFILVNPALESSRFRNLFTAATSTRFSPRQLPVMLTLASESDVPVRLLFPLGQTVSTWQRSVRNREQWQSLLQGVGLYKPFHTHVLEAKPEFKGTSSAASPIASLDGLECACKAGLRQRGDALVTQLEPVYKSIVEAGRGQVRGAQGDSLELASYREFLYATLEPTRPIDVNAPFLTVKVDDDVLDGHGGIFNERFVDFLIEYVALSERKRAATAVGQVVP